MRAIQRRLKGIDHHVQELQGAPSDSYSCSGTPQAPCAAAVRSGQTGRKVASVSLIVEDNPDIVVVRTPVLEHEGFEVGLPLR